jgi:hypothetical protein
LILGEAQLFWKTSPPKINMATITDEDIYTPEVCERIAKIYLEEHMSYWDNSWYEKADIAEMAIIESLPAYQERERQRAIESIAFLQEIETEEQQTRREELAYFGLDRELTDAEHEAISQGYRQYI